MARSTVNLLMQVNLATREHVPDYPGRLARVTTHAPLRLQRSLLAVLVYARYKMGTARHPNASVTRFSRSPSQLSSPSFIPALSFRYVRSLHRHCTRRTLAIPAGVRLTHPRQTLALSAVAVPLEKRACSPLELVFARGTSEVGLGIVGNPLSSKLASLVPGYVDSMLA